MRTKARALPDLPSELLIVAMEDLEAVERSERYRIDMGDWHSPSSESDDEYCSVCHAGAVMANSLQAGINRYCVPSDEVERTKNKLRAINEIREGNIFNFFRYLNILVPGSFIEDGCGSVIKLHHDNEIEMKDGSLEDYSIDGLSNSKDPELFQYYKDWIVGFIGILQAEGL